MWPLPVDIFRCMLRGHPQFMQPLIISFAFDAPRRSRWGVSRLGTEASQSAITWIHNPSSHKPWDTHNHIHTSTSPLRTNTAPRPIEPPNLHPPTRRKHAIVLVTNVRNASHVLLRSKPGTTRQRYQRRRRRITFAVAVISRRDIRHARLVDQSGVGMDAQ